MDRNPKLMPPKGDFPHGETNPEELDVPMVEQDGYRRVLFGQACDPIFPPHPEPAEVSDAELNRQAMEDVPPPEMLADRPSSSVLRWLLLVTIASIALGILLWLRWG